MTPSILVCDRDPEFRTSLYNFLLSAGYSRVESVATLRETLTRLRCGEYRFIIVGLSQPLSTARRLARLTRMRQPKARLVFLVSAADAARVTDTSLVYALKERAFGALAALLSDSSGSAPPETLN